MKIALSSQTHNRRLPCCRRRRLVLQIKVCIFFMPTLLPGRKSRESSYVIFSNLNPQNHRQERKTFCSSNNFLSLRGWCVDRCRGSSLRRCESQQHVTQPKRERDFHINFLVNRMNPCVNFILISIHSDSPPRESEARFMLSIIKPFSLSRVNLLLAAFSSSFLRHGKFSFFLCSGRNFCLASRKKKTAEQINERFAFPRDPVERGNSPLTSKS